MLREEAAHVWLSLGQLIKPSLQYHLYQPDQNSKAAQAEQPLKRQGEGLCGRDCLELKLAAVRSQKKKKRGRVLRQPPLRFFFF